MKKAQKSKQKLGWRSYRIMVDPKTAIHRLSLCPVEGVMEKMRIEILPLKDSETTNITYINGMYTEEEKACVNWILGSRMPDDKRISIENSEAIFAWVRETV